MRIFLYLCIFITFINATPLDSLSKAKQKALELELHKSKQWLDLLHFGNFLALGVRAKVR